MDAKRAQLVDDIKAMSTADLVTLQTYIAGLLDGRADKPKQPKPKAAAVIVCSRCNEVPHRCRCGPWSL